MVYIKSRYDIEQIKKAAAIWKQVKAMLLKETKVGVVLNDLDQKANDLIESLGGKASFYHYQNFPKHICISVNDAIIHGVPNDYQIKANDLVTFDIGVTYGKHICDASFTIHVAPTNDLPAKISQVTYDALMKAIAMIKPGIRVGDISNTIQQFVEQKGYQVIRDFGGHGCGIHMHEDPMILNYGNPTTGSEIVAGMTLCLEPMVMTNNHKYYIDQHDGWTVKSKNRELTCQWEHMVLVTNNGCEILTE